jgi:hypothetical protein
MGERDANVGTSGVNEYNIFTLARIVRQTASVIYSYRKSSLSKCYDLLFE